MPSSDYKNFEYDDWENEFTDHLFDSLSEPFFYPHPREGSPSYYNSDFIQPNLFALQPSYEEIIESSENDAFNFASHFSYSPTPTSELQQQPQQQMIRYDDVYRNQRNSKNINYDDNELPSTSAHSHLSSAAPSSFLAPQNMYQQPIYSQASYNMHSLVNPNNLQQQVHQQQQQHYISLDGSMCGEPLTSTTNSIAATASPHTMPANYEYVPLIISQLNSAQFISANNSSSFLGNGQNRNNYDLSNFNQNINFPFPSNNQEISQSNRYWLNNSSRPQSSLLQQQPTAHMNNSLNNNSNNNGNNPFSLSTNNGRDGNIRSNGFSENVESPPVKMASSLSYGVNNNNVVQPRLHRVINSTQECIGGPSRSGTPSKGALKAYPSAKPLSKHSISSLALSSYRNPDDIYSEKQSKMIKKSKTSIVGKRSMDCDHKKSTSLNEAPLSNNSLESTVTNSLSNSDSPRSLASNDIPVSCKTEIEAFESLPNTPVDSTNQCDSTFISHESRKRILHLYAEKNRRTALKDGFEQLLTILPNLHNNGGKNTNAVVLAKSAEYIRDLKIRTESKEQEVSAIKAKIDEMNEKINHYHSNLPSTSNQSNCNVNSRLSFEHFFERHAKTKSKEDWHFWLMWKLMKNSIDTYSSTIPEGPLSKTETIDNCKKWLMENFDALHLRPSASQLLLFLATEANFMNDAESLPKFISADIDKR